MAELILDKEVFKALSDESRLKILKSLHNQQKTQSELAEDLNFAVPTIAKHIAIMEDARLVKRKPGSRKWIYYELTNKGKMLFTSEKNRQTGIFVLSLCVAFFLISAGVLSFYTTMQYPIIGTRLIEKEVSGAGVAMERITVQEQIVMGMSTIQQINALAVLGMIVGAAILVLLMASKQPTVIIKKREWLASK